MTIYIASGVGIGKTPLSAFDAALKDAGVYNFNLITLSSVIPPKSVIKLRKYKAKSEEIVKLMPVAKNEDPRPTSWSRCLRKVPASPVLSK